MKKIGFGSLFICLLLQSCAENTDIGNSPGGTSENEDSNLKPECSDCDRFEYAAACIAILESEESLTRNSLEDCLLTSPLYSKEEITTKLDLFEERGLVNF